MYLNQSIKSNPLTTSRFQSMSTLLRTLEREGEHFDLELYVQ